MPRARTLPSAICLAAAAVLLAGCGEEAHVPSGGGVVSARPASADAAEGNTFFDRMFGSYSTPSSVAGDTSILDSVSANYETVPGASSLDDTELSSLAMDDDPFDSINTRTLDLGDSAFETVGIDHEPFSALDAPSFEAAAMEAEQVNGGAAGGIDTLGMGLDDVGIGIDDPDLDPELGSSAVDDPELGMAGLGIDDPTLDDPTLDDSSFDDGW